MSLTPQVSCLRCVLITSLNSQSLKSNQRKMVPFSDFWTLLFPESVIPFQILRALVYNPIKGTIPLGSPRGRGVGGQGNASPTHESQRPNAESRCQRERTPHSVACTATALQLIHLYGGPRVGDDGRDDLQIPGRVGNSSAEYQCLAPFCPHAPEILAAAVVGNSESDCIGEAAGRQKLPHHHKPELRCGTVLGQDVQ